MYKQSKTAVFRQYLLGCLLLIFFVLIHSLFSDKNTQQNIKGEETPIQIYTIEDLNDVRNNLSESYILMNDLDFEDPNSWEDYDTNYDIIMGITTVTDENVGSAGFNTFTVDYTPINNTGTITVKTGTTVRDPYEPGVTGGWQVTNYSTGTISFFNSAGTLITPASLYSISTALPIYVSYPLTEVLYTGWIPITTFTGDFNGQNLSISNLFINKPTPQYLGLFGDLSGATISNLNLVNVDITGYSYVGAIAGRITTTSTISNCTVSGSIETLSPSSAYTGGIVGSNAAFGASISDSSTNTSIIGEGWFLGGIAGFNNGTISNAFSQGSIVGQSSYTGGIAGIQNGTIESSHSESTITGPDYCGGLTGENSADILNSYSSGVLNCNEYGGGLVGTHYGSITNSYSSTVVNGTSDIGGLIGSDWGGSVENSFWDTQVSGLEVSGGGTGKTTSQMKDISTYPWDITLLSSINTDSLTTWYIDQGNGYPFLSFQYVRPQVTTQNGRDITTTTATLVGTLDSLGSHTNTQVYFRYKQQLGDWIYTTPVLKTSTGEYTISLSNLTANTSYEYQTVNRFSEYGTSYGNSITFSTLAIPSEIVVPTPEVIPKPQILRIGDITDILNRDYLSYYFTSTKVWIFGSAKPYTAVRFTSNSNSYTTYSNNKGYFTITLNLNKGENILQYYSFDYISNQSESRTLRLIIGVENFPDWLISKLNLESNNETNSQTEQEIPDTGHIVEEESNETDPQEEEYIPTPKVVRVKILDVNGIPISTTSVQVNEKEYITDRNGEIRIENINIDTKYILKLEYKGMEYEKEILGISETGNNLVISISEQDLIEDIDWMKKVLYTLVGVLIVVLAILILILKKRDRKENTYSQY